VSFVLLMHDSDIHPGRSIYDNTHWLVWNIPASATELAEGSPAGPLPEGAIVGKRAGRPGAPAPEPGYAGPCPPPGNPHHYWFELFALDVSLDLPAEATRDEVMRAMDTHIVGKSVYASLFNRP
jgi:Raf kinase inhibitor-like YbhB/YbcL family protein